MFEHSSLVSDLLFQVKLLKDKVTGFESGDKYIRMEEEHKKAALLAPWWVEKAPRICNRRA